MQVNSVSTPSSQTSSDSSTVPLPTQMLSQQDFLNLLVAQMTSQDPLKPIDNQDMLSQMVQFSTLNANTTMQSTLGQLQTGQDFSQAASMLGKQVTLQVDGTTTAQGIVTGIDTSGSVPAITVNGQSYTLSQVLSVANAPTTP
ncbi:MAG TPA: flagellar hook capping FlgD N-terminal domain-containing protein [Verrucomicrobiae bacterium]|jgi:flagellar basal-body rod modification protein FlgD|nr:flagellar hook capping FlgD N-terminal domain-containing protein [Verrucomicrobiae bacterium]